MSPRPRDELGRPLPPGSTDRLERPSLEGLSPDELGALGARLLSQGRAFAAHEAWERAWHDESDEARAAVFKALAQAAVAACHAQRGNARGARRVWRRARAVLDAPGAAVGSLIDLDAVRTAVGESLDRAGSGG